MKKILLAAGLVLFSLMAGFLTARYIVKNERERNLAEARKCWDEVMRAGPEDDVPMKLTQMDNCLRQVGLTRQSFGLSEDSVVFWTNYNSVQKARAILDQIRRGKTDNLPMMIREMDRLIHQAKTSRNKIGILSVEADEFDAVLLMDKMSQERLDGIAEIEKKLSAKTPEQCLRLAQKALAMVYVSDSSTQYWVDGMDVCLKLAKKTRKDIGASDEEIKFFLNSYYQRSAWEMRDELFRETGGKVTVKLLVLDALLKELGWTRKSVELSDEVVRDLLPKKENKGKAKSAPSR